jgi:hypothetical protein
MRRALVTNFRFEGFILGRKKVFKDNPTLERISFAILGPSDKSSKSQKSKSAIVTEALIQLFKVLTEKKNSFKMLRDTELLWTAVGSEWDSVRGLSWNDIRSVAEVYVIGRQAFLEEPRNRSSNRKKKTNTKKTPLHEAVETWTSHFEEVMAMEPLAPRSLTTRRHPVATLADDLGNFSIDSKSTWLPAWVAPQEYAWIADSHIEHQLENGLTENGKTNLPFLPDDPVDIPHIPHNLSHPGDIKMFLCFTGLTRYDPKVSNHAVFMMPIGFFHNKDRNEWFLATGSLSKKHGTFMEFYRHAIRMIENHGRSIVYGITSYWTDLPNQYVKWFGTAKKADGTPYTSRSWYWSDYCLRYGLGLAVCKMPQGQEPGYRVIMYDMDYKNLISHPADPDTGNEDLNELIVCMREWRDVASTAADQAFKDDLKEFWRGGNRPALLTRDYQIPIGERDSIESSCAWLWDMVNGHGPGVDADDKEMTRCKFRSLPFSALFRGRERVFRENLIPLQFLSDRS